MKLKKKKEKQQDTQSVTTITDNPIPIINWNIDPSELIPLSEQHNIKGGTVQKCKWRGETVITKKYSSNFAEWKVESDIYRQIKPHSSIVSFKGFISSDPSIVMEHIPLNLEETVKSQDIPLSMMQKMQIIVDVGYGLHHIHQEGFLHRDIALRNVLLTYEAGDSNRYRAKICDFGWALPMTDIEQARKIPLISAPWRILAPEVVSQTLWSVYSDMWSLGLLIYAVITRKRPWGDISNAEVRALLKSGAGLALYNDEVPSPFLELLNKILSTQPEERGTTRPLCKQLDVIFDELKDQKIIV